MYRNLISAPELWNLTRQLQAGRLFDHIVHSVAGGVGIDRAAGPKFGAGASGANFRRILISE